MPLVERGKKLTKHLSFYTSHAVKATSLALPVDAVTAVEIL